jgi:hypothetical protein
MLSRFAAAKLGLRETSGTTREFIRRVSSANLGEELSFQSPEAALSFLLPAASYPDRYLLTSDGEWSYILFNSASDLPTAEAYAVSRETKCKAVAVVLEAKRREIHVYDKGQQLREIQSLQDGSWYFREVGDPLPFEDPEDSNGTPKRRRLRPTVLTSYFSAFTGRRLPDWHAMARCEAVGFTVAYPNFEEPITYFETVPIATRMQWPVEDVPRSGATVAQKRRK